MARKDHNTRIVSYIVVDYPWNCPWCSRAVDVVSFPKSCGTHVKSTIEIGKIQIGKIENKGKMNRRVNLLLSFIILYHYNL